MKSSVKLLDLDGKDLEREIVRIEKANPKQYRPWTEKEFTILKQLHGKVENKVIAKQLGRNLISVQNKVKYL